MADHGLTLWRRAGGKAVAIEIHRLPPPVTNRPLPKGAARADERGGRRAVRERPPGRRIPPPLAARGGPERPRRALSPTGWARPPCLSRTQTLVRLVLVVQAPGGTDKGPGVAQVLERLPELAATQILVGLAAIEPQADAGLGGTDPVALRDGLAEVEGVAGPDADEVLEGLLHQLVGALSVGTGARRRACACTSGFLAGAPIGCGFGSVRGRCWLPSR